MSASPAIEIEDLHAASLWPSRFVSFLVHRSPRSQMAYFRLLRFELLITKSVRTIATSWQVLGRVKAHCGEIAGFFCGRRSLSVKF